MNGQNARFLNNREVYLELFGPIVAGNPSVGAPRYNPVDA